MVGGDRPLTEDVTQVVFIDLVRKAGNLPRAAIVTGWLYRIVVEVGRAIGETTFTPSAAGSAGR